MTGKPHLSYSSLTSWLDCGERYRLERVVGVTQSPAWWFLGGSAVHTATELHDIGDAAPAVDLFHVAWTKERARIDAPDSAFRSGGRRVSKDWPNKENDAWWLHHGPLMVQSWIDWRVNNPQWQILDIAGQSEDGRDERPGIEVPFQLAYGDTQIQGYIDRVMVNTDTGQVSVVDIKSGSRDPASALQLGVYSRGLAQQYGLTATIGAYWMARRGDLGHTHSLLHFTDDRLAAWFGKAKVGIENEVFIPHVTSFCNTCAVAPHCVAVGGVAP